MNLWELTPQDISAAATSVNKSRVPALFSRISTQFGWQEGTINFDIGGGKWDTATEFLKDHGVTNYIYDPFNRSALHNAAVIAAVSPEKADTVTISNVLNVIQEEDAQKRILEQARHVLKVGGRVFIKVYSGKADGKSSSTLQGRGFQQNKKVAEYLPIVKSVFPAAKVERGIIVARKEME